MNSDNLTFVVDLRLLINFSKVEIIPLKSVI